MMSRFIKRILFLAGALLLAFMPQLVQAHPANVTANAQADDTGSHCLAEITQFVAQPGGQSYILRLSVLGPATVRYAVIQVWDEKSGQLVDPQTSQVDRIFDLHDQDHSIELNTTNWEPEHTYLIKVRAIDEAGQACSNKDENTVLTELKISVPKAPIEFSVNSVTPDFAHKTLQIDLHVLDHHQEYIYFGFINEKGGRRIAEIERRILSGQRISIPLPVLMQKTTGEQTYKLTLSLEQKDGKNQAIEYEFTPPLPPALTIFERIRTALNRYPVILMTIVMLVVSVLFWYVYERLGEKKQPIDPLRPPIDPATRLSPLRSTAEPIHTGVWQKPTMRLRVLQTPIPPVKTELTINDFPFTIGREGCSFNLLDPHVSICHVTIDANDKAKTLRLTDTDSRNGTFIKNRRLTPHTPIALTSTTQICLGRHTVLELAPN